MQPHPMKKRIGSSSHSNCAVILRTVLTTTTNKSFLISELQMKVLIISDFRSNIGNCQVCNKG